MLNRLMKQFVWIAVLFISFPVLAAEESADTTKSTSEAAEAASKTEADSEKAMAELDEMMKNMEKMMFLMEAVQKDTGADNAEIKAAANKIAEAGEAKDDAAMNTALDAYVGLKVKGLSSDETKKWNEALKAFKQMQEQAKEAESIKK